MKYAGHPHGGEGRGPSSEDGLRASDIFEGGPPREHTPAAPPDGVALQPPTAGMRCVGHPLGSEEFCRQWYVEYARKSGLAVDAIERMAGYAHPIAIQTAYLQLRYCAEPRVAHLLRVADPSVIAGGATAHDNHILRGLNTLLGPGYLLQLNGRPAAQVWQDAFEEHGRECPTQEVFDYMSTFATEQARLPLRHGGMGLTSAVASAPAALIGGQCRTTGFLARSTGHSIAVDVDRYVGDLCEGGAPSSIALETF
eukprot:COSAG05_NODE_153_length_15894_cov_27.910415_12_plen_254_part_00